jgi:hypothetical protein
VTCFSTAVQRRLAVLGLADDLEPLRLQHRAGTSAKAGMIVDDQEGRHKLMVAHGPGQQPYG